MESHALPIEPQLPVNTTNWRDRKRYLWPLGLFVPMIPFGCWHMHYMTGLDIFWWYGPIAIFMVFPLLDAWAGMDGRNPPEELIEWLDNDKYYRRCTYAFLPLQFGSLVFACWLWVYGGLSTFDSVGLATSVAMVSGIAIAVAHELGHKKVKMERWLAKISLAQSFYGHFFIEHNRGHHARVSTPEDPASSRLGEGFWLFLPRTFVGSLKSGWNLEKERFARSGKSPWTIKNDVINAWLMSVALFAILIAVFGVEIWPFLLIQAVVGFSLLEVVNYLEHYGLKRQKLENGRYERVLPEHSWNSNNVWSNVMLYHLQRHSDHHANPTRRYQALCDVKEAPQLPTGYAGMILLAVFPPAWRRVMDKRVVAHYGGDVTLANISPRARKRLLKKYGAVTSEVAA